MITILQNGIFDSIQDAGRPGYARWGIAPGGAVDAGAAALANVLVGNSPRQAVLELHFPAAVLAFDAPACIALTGADFAARLHGGSGDEVPGGRPYLLPANSVLRFTRRRAGARVYLAVRGGIDVPEWLGSRATDVSARLPALLGRPLRTGDALPVGATTAAAPTGHRPSWYVPEAVVSPGAQPLKLRFVPGPEWRFLPSWQQSDFDGLAFHVDPASNRMGLRLAGEPLQIQLPYQLVSSGVAFGTLQLLPAGQLVVLLADRGVTGGYPRIGAVAAADWSRLAQLAPGDRVQFSAIDVVEAEKIYLAAQTRQRKIKLAIRLRGLEG